MIYYTNSISEISMLLKQHDFVFMSESKDHKIFVSIGLITYYLKKYIFYTPSNVTIQKCLQKPDL